jgi:hypothetical protein
MTVAFFVGSNPGSGTRIRIKFFFFAFFLMLRLFPLHDFQSSCAYFTQHYMISEFDSFSLNNDIKEQISLRSVSIFYRIKLYSSRSPNQINRHLNVSVLGTCGAWKEKN